MILLTVSFSHGRRTSFYDGICHVYVDGRADHEGQGASRLRDDNDGVHECVDKTGGREDAEEHFSPMGAGTDSDIKQAQDQERKDVFQIVQMSPIKSKQHCF